MANIRQKTAYLCSACGDDFPKWNGQCPSCKEWGTLSEFKTTRKKNNNRIDLKDSRSLNDVLNTNPGDRAGSISRGFSSELSYSSHAMVRRAMVGSKVLIKRNGKPQLGLF